MDAFVRRFARSAAESRADILRDHLEELQADQARVMGMVDAIVTELRSRRRRQ